MRAVVFSLTQCTKELLVGPSSLNLAERSSLGGFKVLIVVSAFSLVGADFLPPRIHGYRVMCSKRVSWGAGVCEASMLIW